MTSAEERQAALPQLSLSISELPLVLYKHHRGAQAVSAAEESFGTTRARHHPGMAPGVLGSALTQNHVRHIWEFT